MVREVDPEAMERIKSHPWLGNVRELATCINNAVKQYPDVEHLVPLHLQFSTTGGAVVTPPADQAPTVPAALPDRIETQTLDDLIRRISSLPLVSQRKAELAGKLPPLQQAFAGLLIRYLKAALEATGRFMPTGDGQFALEVLIHPAMKLVTGNKKLTASKAADVIKRIVRLFPESEAAVQEDPVLREAYETALRLRPKQSKSKEAAEGNTSDGPESE